MSYWPFGGHVVMITWMFYIHMEFWGCRADRSQRVRLNGYIRRSCLYESADINGIPVITGRRPYIQPAARHQHKSVSNLIEIKPEPENNHCSNNLNPNSEPPSLYLLNPTSIMKPNALQQLLTDITSHDIEVVVLAETWMKAHHTENAVQIPGYSVFRRDRQRRRGGGVAIYVKDSMNGSIVQFPAMYEENIELQSPRAPVLCGSGISSTQGSLPCGRII